MQKHSSLIRPIAHLYICPIFDNGLHEMIQGEMRDCLLDKYKTSSLIGSFSLVVLKLIPCKHVYDI